jgi:hypothetical protein
MTARGGAWRRGLAPSGLGRRPRWLGGRPAGGGRRAAAIIRVLVRVLVLADKRIPTLLASGQNLSVDDQGVHQKKHQVCQLAVQTDGSEKQDPTAQLEKLAVAVGNRRGCVGPVLQKKLLKLQKVGRREPRGDIETQRKAALEAKYDVLQAAGCAAGALGHLLKKRVPIRLGRLRGKGSSGSLRRSNLALGRALCDCLRLLPLQSGALCLQKGLGRLEKGLTVGSTARSTTTAAARLAPAGGRLERLLERPRMVLVVDGHRVQGHAQRDVGAGQAEQGAGQGVCNGIPPLRCLKAGGISGLARHRTDSDARDARNATKGNIGHNGAILRELAHLLSSWLLGEARGRGVGVEPSRGLVRLQQLGPVLQVGVEVRDNSQVLEQHPVPSPVAVLLIVSATTSHVHHQARSGMSRRDGP